MLFPSQKPSSSDSLLNFLRHQSVSGAHPPKKNPGSAPVLLPIFASANFGDFKNLAKGLHEN